MKAVWNGVVVAESDDTVVVVSHLGRCGAGSPHPLQVFVSQRGALGLG